MTRPNKKIRKTTSASTEVKGPTYPGWITSHKKISVVLFLYVFLLYANTLGHDYALDDAIVITDNQFTQEGLSGFKGIITKDTFFGYFKEEGKAQLVSGGRYRPLTLLMFATERAFLGEAPWIGHLMNILWYGTLILVLYWLLLNLLMHKYKSAGPWIALLTAVFFAAHPIHTEAVANIKGRDEICSLLFSLVACWFYIKSIDSRKYLNLSLAALSLFLGLLSKENAITFIAIIPLTAYFFKDVSFSRQIPAITFLIIPSLLFIIVRSSVIGQWMGGDPPMELMNNPYLKLEDGRYVPFSFQEKYATITYTLGKYVQLLFWPNPLTHDYYPRQIGILHWGHPGVLASLGIYLAGFIFALRQFRRKTIFSYSFLYFIITLSIVSNIVFPVGTNMSERFLFMPSVAFFLWVAAWMIKNLYQKGLNRLFYIALVLIILPLSWITIDRNGVWKDNATLFLTDVEISIKSAKLQNAAGGEKIRLSTLDEYESERGTLLKEALEHLQQAVRIHPTYKNAYLLMGNANYYLNEYEKSIEAYDNALRLDPNYTEAKNNKGIALRDAGRYYGEQLGDLSKALQFLEESLRYLPEDYEANRLMGVASGISGNVDGAVKYFERAAELLPDNADAWLNLATAYRQTGQMDKAASATEKALQIDPDALNKKGEK